MKITRGYSRKINLGGYETADFWAEYEEEQHIPGTEAEKVLSEALFFSCKDDVQKAIDEFEESRIKVCLEARLKIVQDELTVAKRTKTERELAPFKFQIDLLKQELSWLKGGK